MPELDGQLFSPAEVADLLSESEERVKWWIERHTLPAFTGPDGESKIRRVDLIPFARPLVEPGALDSLEPVGQEADLVGVHGMTVFAELLTSHLTAREFERRARIQPVFHYTSADTALDAILSNGSLRLGPPTGMNDPFESEPLWPSFSSKQPVDPDEFKTDAFFRLSARVSDSLRGRVRLACLTRSGPWEWGGPVGFGNGYARARMWAQYADGHSGVCLAFDQALLHSRFRAQFDDRHDLQPYDTSVRYRADREPSVGIHLPLAEVTADAEGHLNDLFPSLVSEMYFTKAWDWSTETEYRFLVHGNVADYEYLDITDSLTGVFLGPRFPNQRVRDLKARYPAVWDAGRVFQVTWRGAVPVTFPVSDAHIGNGPTWKLPDPPVDLDPPAAPPPEF